jgi:hypothetical protein
VPLAGALARQCLDYELARAVIAIRSSTNAMLNAARFCRQTATALAGQSPRQWHPTLKLGTDSLLQN